MLKLVRRFLADERGNFAIMTGLLMPVVLLAAGVGIDYGIALSSAQKLNSAAQGAVLAGLSEVQARSERGEDIDEDLLTESILGFFNATSGGLVSTDILSATPQVVVNRNEISATLQYRADYRTTLVGIFGKDIVEIANQARAVVTLRSYISINVLVDTSQSMGIGATDNDQRLVAEVLNCAFACHINQARGNSNYDRARNNGATMRIDVARNAISSAIDVVEDAASFEDQVRMGLFKFDNNLTEIISPTNSLASDFAHLRSLVAQEILLGTNYGGTNQEEALHQIAARIPANGTGRSADDRLQYVVVVTDGVESGQAWLASRGWHLHAAASPNAPSQAYAAHEVNYALRTDACQVLRDAGIELYFVYTEYLEPKYGFIGSHDRGRFDFVSDYLFPIIEGRMASCTGTAEHVLHASTPAEINSAFVSIARKLSSPLRLY